MATTIKRSGRYTYRVIEHTAEVCKIEFFEIFNGKMERIGESEFTIEEAKAAGLTGGNPTWNKYPKNMLFARALSNGARWYCPDVFGGSVYTDGEVLESVDPVLPPMERYEAPAPYDVEIEAEVITETTEEVTEEQEPKRVEEAPPAPKDVQEDTDGAMCTDKARVSIIKLAVERYGKTAALESFNTDVLGQYNGAEGMEINAWEDLMGRPLSLVKRYYLTLKRLGD